MAVTRRFSARQRRADRLVRRAALETGAATALVHRAEAALAARAAAGSDRVRFRGRVRTVDQVRALCSALAIAAGPGPGPAGRPLRFAGRGLAAVNVVTLAVVLGGLDGGPDGPGRWVSVVLAVVVSAVQLGLAADLGRRLRPFVGAEAPASPPLVVATGLLVALSGLVGVACDRWARSVDGGNVGVAAGLLLATAAVAAPVMILSDELYGPGAPVRRLRRAERVLTRLDRHDRELDRRGRRLLDAARRKLWQAEQLLDLAADMTGEGEPSVIALGAQLDELTATIRAVWRAYTIAVPPLDPDDLDLAG